VRTGAWQGSKLKSAVMAIVLKRLHRSGWLDNVKAWVCISEFLRGKFVQAGLPAERVFAVRHSWDAMAQAPEVEDGGYYLFLARLVEVKGVEVLLHAWRKLERQMGDKTPELWIGGEGPMEGMVQEMRKKSRKVRFLGLVDGVEKQQALRGCRALLAPSIWWEPLGLVTYEAYDYAKPVLAAASGGLAETVVDGATGFLHEPGNVQALMESVLKMEGMSPEERTAMGAAGRRWLLANAGVEEWRRKMDEVLAGVISGEK
jgi:glycosyltransferase involved in cell wall biosynthesis